MWATWGEQHGSSQDARGRSVQAPPGCRVWGWGEHSGARTAGQSPWRRGRSPAAQPAAAPRAPTPPGSSSRQTRGDRSWTAAGRPRCSLRRVVEVESQVAPVVGGLRRPCGPLSSQVLRYRGAPQLGRAHPAGARPAPEGLVRRWRAKVTLAPPLGGATAMIPLVAAAPIPACSRPWGCCSALAHPNASLLRGPAWVWAWTGCLDRGTGYWNGLAPVRALETSTVEPPMIRSISVSCSDPPMRLRGPLGVRVPYLGAPAWPWGGQRAWRSSLRRGLGPLASPTVRSPRPSTLRTPTSRIHQGIHPTYKSVSCALEAAPLVRAPSSSPASSSPPLQTRPTRPRALTR